MLVGATTAPGCDSGARRRTDASSRANAIVAAGRKSADSELVGELPLGRLRHAVPPFPTRSEIWLSLLEQAGV
jgi:hypothetical protein